MVGGMNRRTPPRELADDPEAWPYGNLTAPGALAVQHIAARLQSELDGHRLSLRGLAELSGVNRQVIADLLGGRSWPDVATVARLGAALDVSLWPTSVTGVKEQSHEPSTPARIRQQDGQA